MNKVSKLCERNAKSSFLVGNSCAPFAIAKPLSLSRRTHCLRTHAPFLFSPMPYRTTTTTNTSLHRTGPPSLHEKRKEKKDGSPTPPAIYPPSSSIPGATPRGIKAKCGGGRATQSSNRFDKMFKELLVLALAAVVLDAQRFPPSFRFQPRQPTFFRRPSAPPPPTFSRPSRPSFSRPSGPPAPSFGRPSRPSGGRGNYQWNGQDFYVSWRDGRKGFTWSAAQAECSSRGMRMISLDDPAKSRHFLGLTGSERQDYFWAGGRISR